MTVSRLSPIMRQAVCLILIQASCVGVGLYMLRHQIAASMQRADESIAITAMVRECALIANTLTENGDDDPTNWTPAEQASVQQQLKRSEAPHIAAMLVDRAGSIVSQARLDDGQPGSEMLSGRINMAAIPTADAVTRADTTPITEIHGRDYVAIRRNLKGHDAVLLLAWPLAQIHATTEARLGSLMAVGTVTFAWILALLAISVWVILARVHERGEQLRSKATSEVLKQAQDLVRTRDAVIFGLAKLADSRDESTGDHLERICAYSTALATALRRSNKYGGQVNAAFVRLIGISAALHDIGKVGIEDSILLKPGPLTIAERERMQCHALIGARCLEEIEQRLGRSNFLQMAREIALGHHEHWDGSGYPNHVSGERIPLAARIVAIADLYDALVSARVYKQAYTHDHSVEMIRALSGTQLDPALVTVFLSIEGRFREIARQFGAIQSRDAAEAADARRSDPPDILEEIARAGITEPLPTVGNPPVILDAVTRR